MFSRTAASAAVLLAMACSHADSPDAATRQQARPSATTVIHCEPSIAAPEGFEATKVTPVPETGHTGIRRSYKDSEGRLLHISAGIPGEYGEGAELVEDIALAQGRGDGSLYGAGDTWVLVWDEGGPCGYMAVIGNGFSRDDLVKVLGDIGLV